ncbi:hypothetical protein [Tamlana crocina]|uniref:Lipoprotein n=1 Tax=Tamlana crocina TaxID=393006 RepID=A0ABX1DDS7_9FLAO|nr:hypothetical protein [Tamlana crocina]NJX16500.1 hypothetical protein [Tamlana crocina]
MNLKITLITILSIITLNSCKKEQTFNDYKYSDKPAVINCDGVNSKLLNEAVYAFENDILNYQKQSNPNASLVRAYSQTIRSSVYSKLKFDKIVSEHTYKVFQALKNENDLWDANNTKSHLNYNGKTMACIASHIKNEALKTTMNALLSTNTMSPKLFGTPLTSKYSSAMSDKYLALYIALDLFYAKMFDFDFSNVNFSQSAAEEKVDFNKIPTSAPVDPHAGHNHN